MTSLLRYTRRPIPLAVLFAVLALALTATALFAAGGKKADSAVVSGQTVLAAIAHGVPLSPGLSGTDDAGVDAVGEAKIKKIGKVSVRVSSSWDWDAYDGIKHPAALVNVASPTFTMALFFTNSFPIPTGVGVFTPTDTVTFTRPNGDTMTARITGGSVYELKWILDTGAIVPVGSPGTVDGTINQGITTFELNDDGTGKLAGITGSGIINAVFNSLTGEFEINDIFTRFSKPRSEKSEKSTS